MDETKQSKTSEPDDATRKAAGNGDRYFPAEVNVDPTSDARAVADATPRSLTGPERQGPRYREGAILGRGGMGEVHAARDRRIGRSVAIKVMLEEDLLQPDAQRRFLREARVQGQLEHPAVVPVYDLDWDEEGRPYFAMKRVAGDTLAAVMNRLRKGDAEYEAKYSLRRLLSNFQQVCLALEYAHARGVVHRDVKPSNIMFGDFGEIYILDWGIAKLAHSADLEMFRASPSGRDGDTAADEVLGTVGYMAPEQMTGASDVDARADVYSLGSVLFQMLTLEPLHGRGTPRERARSTQEGADARASRRAPDRDIPPELDAICVRATAMHPDERYPTARALSDAIEAFLEGDRDMRLRAELAVQHVYNARLATDRMLEPGSDHTKYRKRALVEAGRALALDPKNEDAATIVARVMLEAPHEVPADVREAGEKRERDELREGVRISSLALVGVVACSVFLPLLGAIRSPTGVAVILGSIAFAAVYGLVTSTFRKRFSRVHIVFLAVPICVAISGFSTLVGPYMVPPLLALGFAALICVSYWLGRYRYLMIGLTILSWLVPAILDWAGIGGQPAYGFEDGLMIVYPRLMELPEAATRAGLIALFLAATLVVSGIMLRYASWVAASREQLQLNAWHLESFLPRPRETHSSVPPRPAATSLPPDLEKTQAARGFASGEND